MELKRTAENCIWIRGNDKYPKKVIAVLESRGGENKTSLSGRCPELAYYICDDGTIACVPLDSNTGRRIQETFGELHLTRIACVECRIRKFPVCDLGIACCKCDNEDCNSRQPCPQKMEALL